MALVTMKVRKIRGVAYPEMSPCPPSQGYGTPPGHGPVTSEQILAERFARGEIDEDEFWRRKTTLRAGR